MKGNRRTIFATSTVSKTRSRPWPTRKSARAATATLSSMPTKPRTMPGVLELLPSAQTAFQGMIDTVRRVYELHGFSPIETPALELSDVLLTKTGGETERQVYLAQSSGARAQGKEPDLALRFDLTVPLARYVAEHQADLVFPFRRYQIQRVYRGESAQRGRFREFYQADIDIVGRDQLDIVADAECPAVIVDVFSQLGIGSFTIRVNNRKLLQGFLMSIGVEADRHAVVLREIDKLEKRGPQAVGETLVELGMSLSEIEQLLGFVAYSSDGMASALVYLGTLEVAENQGRDVAEMINGRDELIAVFQALRDLGVEDEVVVLDCSIARGLDYYTGTVFETILTGHPEIGSICSGGRYDNLADLYTSTHLPGVGMSIGLTRLFWQLNEIGLVASGGSPTAAYVTIMDNGGVAHARALASSLRRAGVPTQVASAIGRLKKQLKYADRLGIHFVLIAGESERDRGVVTIKDMRNGDQIEVPEAELANELRNRGTK